MTRFQVFFMISRLRKNGTLKWMGRTKGAYNAEFPAGTLVRVVSLPQLQEFRRTWYFHHALTEDQLACADAQARVLDVGFYHGGDELYHLEGIAGIWHECCLELSEVT